MELLLIYMKLTRFKAFEFHLDFIKHPEVQEYLRVIQLDLRKAYF